MTVPDPYILTPDEQLLRHPRWKEEPTDLKTSLKNLAKTHWPDNFDIDESEEWDAYFDELVGMVAQMIEEAYQRGLSEGERDEQM